MKIVQAEFKESVIQFLKNPLFKFFKKAISILNIITYIILISHT